MFRISVLLMAILLIFSTMPVSLAQQQSLQAQAEADAHTDVNRDMRESLWFTSGLMGNTVGCAAGGTGGFLFGLLIGGCLETNCISFISDDPLESCTITGAILCGVLTVPTAIFIYPHNPSPPLERLLGKPPEYIEVYLQAYRSKTISLRKRWVTAGSITANLGVGAMLLLDNIANR